MTTPSPDKHQQLSQVAGGDAKWNSQTGKWFCNFLIKFNILLPDDNPSMGYLQKPVPTQNKKHTWMFIAAQFIFTKNWKQFKCPSTSEWINKLWYWNTIKQSSTRQRNKLLIHETGRVNLRCIPLSERSQTQKMTYCMIPLVWLSYDNLEEAKRSGWRKTSDWPSWGRGSWKQRGSSENGVMQLRVLVKTHRPINQKSGFYYM